MVNAVITGLLIPFVGTSLGAACVLFMKNRKGEAEGEHSHVGVLMFSIGFTVMMALDVALG